MSIAKTPSAELTYKGFTQTRTAENLQTTITYQSTEQKLNAMITGVGHETSGWYIGMSGAFGNLDKITMKQEEGPFWHADLQWNNPLSGGLNIEWGDKSKPTESTLTVTMLEMALQTAPNYRKIWNWYLAAKDGAEDIPTLQTLLSSDEDASNALTNGRTDLKWIKDSSELPQPEWDDVTSSFVAWNIAQKPTKQGIEYYVIPTYEITEYAKHNSKENAAWSMSTRSGKLKFPQNGDFGLEARYPASADAEGRTGRRWLCMGGGVSFDGKNYIAQCTYRWANEATGWDNDLYSQPSSADGGYNSSYPLPDIFQQAAPNNN